MQFRKLFIFMLMDCWIHSFNIMQFQSCIKSCSKLFVLNLLHINDPSTTSNTPSCALHTHNGFGSRIKDTTSTPMWTSSSFVLACRLYLFCVCNCVCSRPCVPGLVVVVVENTTSFSTARAFLLSVIVILRAISLTELRKMKKKRFSRNITTKVVVVCGKFWEKYYETWKKARRLWERCKAFVGK